MSKKNQLTTTDYLSTAEYLRLVRFLQRDRNILGETYVRIAKATALRISDVLSIKWGQILTDSFVFDEKKTGKHRPIKFPKKTQDIFQRLYKMHGEPGLDALVFINLRTGKPYTKQYINMLQKEWKEKYQIVIGNFSSHSFRKAFGREFWDKMGNTDEALVRLSEIYNHTSISITRRYLGIRDEEVMEAYDMIEV